MSQTLPPGYVSYGGVPADPTLTMPPTNTYQNEPPGWFPPLAPGFNPNDLPPQVTPSSGPSLGMLAIVLGVGAAVAFAFKE